MQRDANRSRAGFVQPSDIRRARTLAAALSFVLAGAAFYAHNVGAQPCGSQSDFLAGAQPLPAPVRPADCSHVYQAAPAFTWPEVKGAATYTVVVTYPDGSKAARSTDRNWLAWDEALPAGAYRWEVTASGATRKTSQPRIFIVDASTAAPAAARAIDNPHDAASPSTYPRDSHGISTLAVTAPTKRETADRASMRAQAPAAIAWTSPGFAASQAD